MSLKATLDDRDIDQFDDRGRITVRVIMNLRKPISAISPRALIFDFHGRVDAHAEPKRVLRIGRLAQG